MILVKIEIFLFACFWTKMGLEITFADHPLRTKAFLEEKNIDCTQWTYWDCFEGVNP